MAIRKLYLHWDRQRKGVCLPLRGSLRRSVASNVAAVCHLSEMKLSAVKVGVECVFIHGRANSPSNVPQITYLRSSIRISTSRPTALLLSRRLSSPNSVTQLSPAAMPAVLPPANLLSRLKDQVMQHKSRSRSGKYQRYSTRERLCRERNIWYAGKIHGCSKVN